MILKVQYTKLKILQKYSDLHPSNVELRKYDENRLFVSKEYIDVYDGLLSRVSRVLLVIQRMGEKEAWK